MSNDTHCFRDDHAVYREVMNARRAAHAKHGALHSIEGVDPSEGRWLAIFVEEVGEVANCLTYDGPREKLRAELVDVMAVASAAIDQLDGRVLT